ncbi:MAG TPA: MlaD family protein [Actinokineospora sp.]|nr:MlaD family protein [Actinokineospora sp.]
MRDLAGPLVKGVIFAAVTLLATLMLGLTIANRNSGDTASYKARFTDVTSLNAGDDVRMSGVRVGQVDDIEIVDGRSAEITFSVDRRWPLSVSTTAAIKFRNLIGQRYIALDRGPGEATPLAEDGTIPLERTKPALDLTAMFNGFKPLFQALAPEDVNQLSFEIVQVLQGEGGTIQGLVQHTSSLTHALADKDKVIGQVVTNLNTVLDQVNSRGDALSTLVTTTQELVSGLAKDAEPIGEAIDGIAALTTSTAGLLQAGREPLRRDIDALGALSKSLADNTPEFEKFISALPGKYEAIGRTASYGSWLNLYLCGATSTAAPAPQLPGTAPVPVGIPVTDRRCMR